VVERTTMKVRNLPVRRMQQIPSSTRILAAGFPRTGRRAGSSEVELMKSLRGTVQNIFAVQLVFWSFNTGGLVIVHFADRRNMRLRSYYKTIWFDEDLEIGVCYPKRRSSFYCLPNTTVWRKKWIIRLGTIARGELMQPNRGVAQELSRLSLKIHLSDRVATCLYVILMVVFSVSRVLHFLLG